MRFQNSLSLMTIWVAVGATGCLEKYPAETGTPGEEADADTDADADADAFPGNSITEPDADGIRTIYIDSTSSEDWIHFDLDTFTATDDPDAWAIATQRYVVKVNGGVSGSGNVEAVFTDDDFDTVQSSPETGWSSDLEDADEDGKPEYVFDSWFNYDSSTHVLTPKSGTWFVSTPGDTTHALQILDYYWGGDSGYFTMRTRPVLDRRNFAGMKDASDGDSPVYIQMHRLETVGTPSDPAADLGWDLSLARTSLRVNGGVSGSGAGQAYTYPDGTLWEDVQVAPDASMAWGTDETSASPYSDGTALSTWYDYDMSTHTVSASGRVHAVMDANGTPWKLEVTEWNDGELSIRVARLEPTP
jgi:hypothetical protein